MQVFSRAAALGSFSAAARALGLSQSMVTKHIVAIEDRLGVRLFNRTTRRLTLTDAGARYLETCERILSEIEEADAEAAAESVEPRGTLRLNGPLVFGIRELMPALADFAALYPALTLDIGLTDRFVDLVDEGWDIAIRIGALKDSTLIARKLATVSVILCAAPSYLEAHGTPRTVADLAHHNCLGYTLPTAASAGRWAFGPDGSVAASVSGTLRVNNGDALLIAALAGRGLIYQPSFIVAEDIRSGRLAPIALDQPVPRFGNVNAVYPPGRHPVAKVRLLIDFLAERWSGIPPWEAGITHPVTPAPDHGRG
jgi:DNA-binding transcriptional LysR family regulator